MSSSGPRRREWSLEGARLVLADVRACTQRAVERIERLGGPGGLVGEEDVVSGENAEAVQEALSAWVREMEALGVAVKGPWRVDFDCGDGAYSWRWPETELAYFQGDDEGFEGRVRIQ